MQLIYTLLSVIGISLVSFAGVFTLSWRKKAVHSVLSLLVALAAGTMIGTTFLHLLPEAAESLEPEKLFGAVLISFLIFFSIERFLHWRHCHEDDCEVHTYGYMNLLGDGVHNFLDGVIIAAAYGAGFEIGVATTVAVILHEIPQEIGDFGVLLKAGYSEKKALFMNFVSALAAVLGGVVGYVLASQSEVFVQFLTPFAAGSFLYIAGTDLLPQLQNEKSKQKSALSMFVFLGGVLLMFMLQLLVHEPGH